jgi:hypothetical protein
MGATLSLFNEEAQYLERLKTSWNQTIKGDGGNCPCCGKWGKVYKTKLNQHLALCLKWMVDHAGEDGWVDVQNRGPRWMLKSKTYPLLEHWNLIESKANRSGIWRATSSGNQFVKSQISLPEAVYIYDNRRWGFEDKLVMFRQCFGKHFNFEELMSVQFNWANLVK